MTRSKAFEHFEDLFVQSGPLLKALAREGDRGCILAGSAFIDQALRDMLQAVFAVTSAPSRKQLKALFEDEGAPLRYFAARHRLCRALGFIDIATDNLCTAIRKLRKRPFAHEAGCVELSASILKDIREAHKGLVQLSESKPLQNPKIWKEICAEQAYPPPSDARCELMGIMIDLWTRLNGTTRQLSRKTFVEHMRRACKYVNPCSSH